ncbi:MAG: head GIN domain-containing protein [Bacteroidota bacterium]
MKTKMSFGLLATILLITACNSETIRVSDTITTETYAFSDYSTLQISGDMDAFVQFSDSVEQIEIETNENLQDKIIVSKDGNTLRIRLEDNIGIKGNATMKAYITTANISGYRISGDSSVALENTLSTDEVSVNLSGNSNFSGQLAVNTLDVDLQGDSECNVFGTARSVNAAIQGDSELKDYDLNVNDLVIDLSGDSEAFLSVSNTIDVNASGDSELNYRGDAEITRQRLSGDAKVNKRD